MQFCPRCGSRNQDDRAACWKCFAQLQKTDSKKAQYILLKDTDTPVSDVRMAAIPLAVEPVAPAAPIPELVEPSSAAPIPDLTFDLPASEPEIPQPAVSEEPAHPAAPLGDVMLSSPSFDTTDQADEVQQPVPILGLVDLPEDEQEPATVDLDAPDQPLMGARQVSDESLIVEPTDDAQSLEGTGEPPLPWWMTQDEAEEAPGEEEAKPVLDLDDGGLEIIPMDDTRKIVSFEDEDEDPDEKK